MSGLRPDAVACPHWGYSRVSQCVIWGGSRPADRSDGVRVRRDVGGSVCPIGRMKARVVHRSSSPACRLAGPNIGRPVRGGAGVVVVRFRSRGVSCWSGVDGGLGGFWSAVFGAQNAAYPVLTPRLRCERCPETGVNDVLKSDTAGGAVVISQDVGDGPGAGSRVTTLSRSTPAGIAR
jgi:hypothetical protein